MGSMYWPTNEPIFRDETGTPGETEKGHHCYRPFVRGRSLGDMHVNA
jgi:hypothetical protein